MMRSEKAGQAVAGGAWHTGDSRTNNNNKEHCCAHKHKIHRMHKNENVEQNKFCQCLLRYGPGAVHARTVPRPPLKPPGFSTSCPMLYGSCHIGQLFALFQWFYMTQIYAHAKCEDKKRQSEKEAASVGKRKVAQADREREWEKWQRRRSDVQQAQLKMQHTKCTAKPASHCVYAL